MRMLTVLLAATGLVLSDRPSAAQEKVAAAKWEYAELSYRLTPGRPPGKDKDGNEVLPTKGESTVRWTTGSEEVVVKAWDELAEKLKAPVKKDVPASVQKVQALNALGAAGWELVGQESNAAAASGFGRPGNATTWLFKRRLP